MSDAEWVLVRDLLPVPGMLAARGGRPEGYCHRQMIDAVRYLVDNGINWRAMPSDFPPGRGCMPSSSAGGMRGWWPNCMNGYARPSAGLRAAAGAERGGRGLAVGEGGRHAHPPFAGIRRREEDIRCGRTVKQRATSEVLAGLSGRPRLHRRGRHESGSGADSRSSG
ncbi:transposase [Streptomyces sp. NPDC007189]|uniref:transposase n=1 Tax=Streptomyces sp. NPDC007189 TaxID=3154315 RepID=UPI003456D4DF